MTPGRPARTCRLRQQRPGGSHGETFTLLDHGGNIRAPVTCRPAAGGQNPHAQFNVPYACPDGSTYVVHRCATGPKGEFCYFQRDQNSERYNTRSAVENLLGQCKLKGPASPAATSTAQPSADLQLNTPYQCAGGLVLTVFQCQKQNGQDYCFIKVEQNGKFTSCRFPSRAAKRQTS